MKRDIFWMVWGLVGLVLVLVLGTKSFVAEASHDDIKPTLKNKQSKAVILSPEQYKVIKHLNFKNNR